MLATCSDSSVRNGPRAIELAQHALELTKGKNAVVLGTLAAAYAEGGRFVEAVTTGEQAVQLALNYGNSTLAGALQSQVELYLKGVPYHERVPESVPRTDANPVFH